MLKNNVLVLRTCNQDMTAHGGFKWPTSGPVSCPDWKPTQECGNGLHGLLWGVGDGSLLNFNGKWLVVSVPQDTIVSLGGKVKFPAGEVVYCGDRQGATDYIAQFAPIDSAIVGRVAAVGDLKSIVVGYGGTATAGYNGTATAGNFGTATAGDWGTATAGNFGTATAGKYGTAIAGDNGTAIAGNKGTATAGYGGTATAGEYGTAIAGEYGTATAGSYGIATTGDDGTSAAGSHGTATAGDSGIIRIDYYDERKRTLVGYIGETLDIDGIPLKPNTPYNVVAGKFKEET